jgi:glycosyltransferase involved in cell wall biosynthesis
VVGTIESCSDLRNEPTVPAELVRLWEHTILRSDYLFSNSESVQKSLEQEYQLQSEIIPTGVDSKFFVPDFDRAENERLRVLFVGSFRSYKQPHLLVDAAWRFPQADFRLAGEGPLETELRRAIADRGLSNITLLGPLAAEQLRTEYQGADIFLFPSRWEGSPKVVLEAAACGLPVILRKDYSAETVIHGVTGYKASTDEQLLEYLRLLLNAQSLRQELGRRARKHIEKYDWDAVTARWEDAFTRLVPQATAKKVS